MRPDLRGEAFRTPSRRPSPRGAPPTRNSTQRTPRFRRSPRPRGEAFGHRANTLRRENAPPTENSTQRATRFVGAPISGRTEPTPLAVRRACHRKRRPAPGDVDSAVLANSVPPQLVGHGGVRNAKALAQQPAAWMALIQLLQHGLFEAADNAVQIAVQREVTQRLR